MKPIPVLQTINLVFALFILALEWPLGFIAGSTLHCSLEFRLAILPLTAVAAALMYQATNSAVYYFIGVTVYFCAYSEGEVRWTIIHSRLLDWRTDSSLAVENLRKTVDSSPWL